MRHKRAFQRELGARTKIGTEAGFVLGHLRHHSAEEDPLFAQALRSAGLQSFPYVLVMPRGERTLDKAVKHENFAGHSGQQEMERVKQVTREMARALAHLHGKGLVHGDVKPMNCIRLNGR